MIIYKSFDGKEFKNEKEYNGHIETLLNKPLVHFNAFALDNFINEYFPKEYKGMKLLNFKDKTINPIYNRIEKNVLNLDVAIASVDCEKVKFNINALISCDEKYESKLNFSTFTSLKSNILLKNFQDEFFKCLKHIMVAWKFNSLKTIELIDTSVYKTKE